MPYLADNLNYALRGLGLPKPLRDVLERLAKQQRVDELVSEMLRYIRSLDPDVEMPGMPEYDPDREGDVKWNEGVEEFADRSMAELWGFLGVTRLPFFNEWFDLLNSEDGWSDAETAARIQQSGEPLRPRWHQLVGIIKMLTNVFAGKPVLLMDDVGIGKTMQVVGLIAMLAYYREYHDEHKRFPGYFSMSPFSVIFLQ